MALKAKVLYDFHSENPGEISIAENEVVTLFSEEELEGWLEGENSRGEAGLFPASYVEIIRDHITSNNNGFSLTQTKVQTSYTSSQPHRGFGADSSSFHTSQDSDDDWDDEWDDSSPVANVPQGLGSSPPLHPVATSLPGRGSSQQQQAKSSATVGRNLNRFSTFVKSGGEAFLLGEASAFVKDGDRICVVMGKHGPEWQEDPYPFTCTIDDPTKQTKFKGMKSYMSYGLTPTHTNVQVNRRYVSSSFFSTFQLFTAVYEMLKTELWIFAIWSLLLFPLRGSLNSFHIVSMSLCLSVELHSNSLRACWEKVPALPLLLSFSLHLTTCSWHLPYLAYSTSPNFSPLHSSLQV